MVTEPALVAPASAGDHDAIDLSSVSYAYRHRRRHVVALDSLTLRVQRGEVVALLGESGSGKSTALSLIAGLHTPTAGSVRVLGVDLGGLPSSERARFRLQHIAQIYQDFRLLPVLTASENVSFILRLKGAPEREARERAAAALVSVGLGHRSDHLPKELSGGEQQRVSIARALVSQPDILLADEPTGSLDADLRDENLELMLSVLAGATIVLVTHDPVVAQCANRTVRIGAPG
jgi:ABC-type lipoprotein export system ATPase subunit